MRLFSIDPGPTQSAFAYLIDGSLTAFEKCTNEQMLTILAKNEYDEVVIEMIASYGMATGQEVYETCVWVGRFWQAAKAKCAVHRLMRADVKLHLCKSMKANDSTIRQALIDRYGGKEKAIGNKKNTGPLYGVTKDCWQALALGLTWWDRKGRVSA